ncbi:RNase adapter RapZ [Thiorhodovibrio frisius]|uniref:Putative P-loop-containing kinase n=1 Tax=Thiorhodovibrio frisius TaxID=631362 RepID=H8YZT2_9GAMM|nr:RNase adapter RapZ [Thiorhodovibrio frisius]EIC22209.1 putative P-loop-containing kinase [Thiorhodovibrio frisius]WPL24503.1 glmZ(sRNA)-inactivating NTPase [Thiorhodovibrio frisius]
MDFIIVSGLSGAGKSVALNTLEDIGYNCIDNLPLFLLSELALGLLQSEPVLCPECVGTAVGIDARSNPDDLRQLPQVLVSLGKQGIIPRLIFLEAQTERLMTRFSETRRKHPLTSEQRSLAEAIDYERELLEPLRQVADAHIDTTHINIHELRDLVRGCLGDGQKLSTSILLQSFGFKKGVPESFDFVFDVRCLPNPHWQEELRGQTGRDLAVINYLEGFEEVVAMRDDLIAFLDRWTPCFERDGRSYLTIAIGCTGGQHRSVYMAEAVRAHFDRGGRRALVRHRELP